MEALGVGQYCPPEHHVTEGAIDESTPDLFSEIDESTPYLFSLIFLKYNLLLSQQR